LIAIYGKPAGLSAREPRSAFHQHRRELAPPPARRARTWHDQQVQEFMIKPDKARCLPVHTPCDRANVPGPTSSPEWKRCRPVDTRTVAPVQFRTSNKPSVAVRHSSESWSSSSSETTLTTVLSRRDRGWPLVCLLRQGRATDPTAKTAATSHPGLLGHSPRGVDACPHEAQVLSGWVSPLIGASFS
jgi:hypothetical protein